jgi:tRNA (cmo5U34)-methyltransferase
MFASEAFNDQATEYEAQRRLLIPPYDRFYGTAVQALELSGRRLDRILDLGAGTGLLARHVARAFPDAQLTLLDGAPAMLAQAQEHFGESVAGLVQDLSDPLPNGPWDAVVSALAIHHLSDDAKRQLFSRTHHALSPGGVFVNAEQVAGPTALFDDCYAAWHRHEAMRRGASEAQWQGAEDRMRHDRWATVEHQLSWLREAGFADADCLFKQHRFAVFVARRAG